MAANINLLPDVRVVRIKASQQKKLASTITIMIGTLTGAIILGLILAIGFYAGQSRIREGEAKDLQAEVDQKKDLEQSASTIQEHLKSFTKLNSNRVAAQSIFTHLVRTIPPNVTVKSLSQNEGNKITIAGETTDYKQLGVFVKALEEYNVSFKPQADSGKPIFTDVTIDQATKDTKTNQVTFSITATVDEKIFKVNKNIGQ